MKLFFLYLLPVRDTFWAKYELALVLLVQDYPLGGGPLKMVLIVNATQINFKVYQLEGVKVSFYLCYLPWIQRDRTTEFDLLLWSKKLRGQYNDDTSQKSLAFQTVYPM